MVAVHASTRYEKRRVQPHKGDTSGGDTTDCASGTNWLRCGLERTTGRVKENFKALEDEKIVTFALDSVNLSTTHRTNTVKTDEAPIIHTREEGPTVQLCGESEVAWKWINGQYSMEQRDKGKLLLTEATILEHGRW